MTMILLLEDEAPMRELIKEELEEQGYRVDEAADLKTADRKLQQTEYDVIIMDLVLPDGNSISLLDKYPGKLSSRTIIITANPTIPGVVQAIKNGAYNYLEKPIDPDVLASQVEKILQLNQLTFEHQIMSAEMGTCFTFDSIVYRSKEMEEVIQRAKVLAETGNTILIQGETGCGKEVLAHALHNHSSRRKGAFMPVNCAAIPSELFESELFGYEKGAFTGASNCYSGRFIQADGGTLFLDEIGELPQAIQAKLLRILDDKKIYRLSSKDPVEVDVRLIAATNRDLQQEAKAKEFRTDLYYRLRESWLHIPPLRERQEDILALFRHYMKIYSHLFKKDVKHISREAEQSLLNHKWEGNVRELKNAVKSIIPFKCSDTIEVEDLSPVIIEKSERSQLTTLEEMENRYILKVLRITGFNISRAAEILGIARTRIYRKLKHLELQEE